MKTCPLCDNYPQSKLSKTGYKFFYCFCGTSDSGNITENAIANWNSLVEERKTMLLVAIAKKSGVTVIDQESAKAYDILVGKIDQRSLK